MTLDGYQPSLENDSGGQNPPSCDSSVTPPVTLEAYRQEIARLNQWVHDLQSQKYINCVYCGHRYGPEDNLPDNMQEALRKHIEECPKHPLSHAKDQIAALQKSIEEYEHWERILENIKKDFHEPEKILGAAYALIAFMVEANAEVTTFRIMGLKHKDKVLGNFKLSIEEIDSIDDEDVEES